MGLGAQDAKAKPKLVPSQELLGLAIWGKEAEKVMKDSSVNQERRLQLTFQLKVTLLVKYFFK